MQASQVQLLGWGSPVAARWKAIQGVSAWGSGESKVLDRSDTVSLPQLIGRVAAEIMYYHILDSGHSGLPEFEEITVGGILMQGHIKIAGHGRRLSSWRNVPS